MQDKQCNICHRCFPPTTEYFNVKLTSDDGMTKACTRCCVKANGGKFAKPYRVKPKGESRQSRVRVNDAGETELRCGHCKQWFSATVEYFYVNRKKALGLSTNCRACHRAFVAKTPSSTDPTYRSPAEQVELERRAAEYQQRKSMWARNHKLREHQRLADKAARYDRTIIAENKRLATDGLCRCVICKEVYPLDWAHFGTKRHSGALSAECFLCRMPNEFGGREGALVQLQVRKNPVLWAKQEEQRLNKAREQDRKNAKKYRQSPKGKRVTQVKTQTKRARKQALPDTLTSRQWSDCLDYFGHRCAVCGQPAGMFTTLAQDHWIPLAYKGADNPGTVVTNIIPLCHSLEQGMMGCNNCKRDQNAHEWLVSTYGVRKAKQIEARINAYFDSVRRFEAVS